MFNWIHRTFFILIKVIIKYNNKKKQNESFYIVLKKCTRITITILNKTNNITLYNW